MILLLYLRSLGLVHRLLYLFISWGPIDIRSWFVHDSASLILSGRIKRRKEEERRERTYVQTEALNVIYLIPQQLLGWYHQQVQVLLWLSTISICSDPGLWFLILAPCFFPLCPSFHHFWLPPVLSLYLTSYKDTNLPSSKSVHSPVERWPKLMSDLEMIVYLTLLL